MNPYASEDFSRIKVKGTPKEERDQRVDHPLMEGKKLEMNEKELRTFTKAMEQPEFREMMGEYVNEISDPKHRPEQDQYLRELEERGEMPPGTALIEPKAGFCIKSMSKRMVSDINKSFFDQKTFINVCWHESIEKPQQTAQTDPKTGQQGTSWGLPYRCSKGKHDQDKKGQVCMTYDVVFHPDVASFLIYPDFKKFVADTALDGVNRVLAENKEKVSTDYKILKHINCKGEKPQLMSIKVKTDNPLINNMDVSQHETKFQKDISKQKEQTLKEQEAAKKLKEEQDKERKAKEEIEKEDDEEEEPEQRPKGIVQPKYKVVHSYPANLIDNWEGHKDTAEEALLQQKPKTPTELTVTIYAKFIDSMKRAKLDINESTLIFEYPDLYYLDLNLKYRCDSENGSAKFDKKRQTLTIRMAVLGLTKDSQKVTDENFQAFQERQREQAEQLKKLELQKEFFKNKHKVDEQNEEADKETTAQSDAQAALPPMASEGMSNKTFVQSMDPLDDQIKDNYNIEQIKDGNTLKDDLQKNIDETQQKREDFLNIYKEKEQVENDESPDYDINKEGVRFKTSQDENQEIDSHIKVTSLNDKGNGAKPLIQELSSSEAKAVQEKKEAEKVAAPPKPKFNWETAERIELKTQFLTQPDYVFLNVNFKGYQKDKDVRYALSSDEFLIEIRDKEGKVHRLCQTLHKQIDVGRSSIDQLVNFVCVKLCKQERAASWSQFGYDIKEFTVPEKTQMKSNFLKAQAKPVEEKKEAVVAKKEEATENTEEDAEPEKKVQESVVEQVEDEPESKEMTDEDIKEAIARSGHKQASFLSLSCESLVFKIY